jgi:hypothetical protein
MNVKYQTKELWKISESLFQDVISECLNEGLTSFAPLGASSDDFILYTCFNKDVSRVNRDRQLSVRLHNSQLEMLLTDRNGRFMAHIKFHKSLGVEFIAKEFFRVFAIMNQSLVKSTYEDMAENLTTHK